MARTLSLMSGGRPVNPDHIVVSSGSKQAIFNACFSLFGPKDKVLIPSPAWVSYPQIVHLCRAEPVAVPGRSRVGSQGQRSADLERHTDKLVRGLILCSPCNPTGAVYTAAEVKAIAKWAREHSDLDHLPTRSTAASTTETDRPPRSSICRTSSWSGWW